MGDRYIRASITQICLLALSPAGCCLSVTKSRHTSGELEVVPGERQLNSSVAWKWDVQKGQTCF